MAARVSPAEAAPLPPQQQQQLPRTILEFRKGRRLAVCHLKPQQQREPSSPRRVAFLFHGVGGSAEVFHHQVPLLLRLGYEVVAPDQLGHGASATSRHPDDFTFAALRRDALEIFDELAGPGGDNVLIGHSYGTVFVVYLCHERAARVSMAIQMAGGGPHPLGLESSSMFSCCTCFYVCAGPALRRLLRARFFRSASTVCDRDRRLAFNIGAREFKMVMNGQSWPEGDWYYHTEVRTPTLLIHGEADRLISLDEQKEMLRALSGLKSLVTVSGAGHMMMLEQPDVINAHLAEFLTTSAADCAAAGSASASNASGSQALPRPQPQQQYSRRTGFVKSLPCASQLLRFHPQS